MTQIATTRPGWLEALPKQDGFVCISESRRFAHDEEKYDAQYSNDPANMQVGAGLVALLKREEADFGGPALEVGCGTGLVSLGLAAASPYPLTILTDPSPVFLRITRAKIRRSDLTEDRLCYAVLKGEEIDRLPAGSVSLIVLRSTLHHILDVDAFIANAARALRPGGVLTFEEPCLEDVLMGAMLQFLPAVAKAAGRPLTDPQLAHVDLFVRTMSFYARRDLDKTQAEDKHVFRVDEVMRAGATCRLEFKFLANRTYETFTGDESGPESAFFQRFTRDYLKYCMSWPDDLMAVFDALMPDYCRFVAEASAGGSGPYLHGVFIGRKRE